MIFSDTNISQKRTSSCGEDALPNGRLGEIRMRSGCDKLSIASGDTGLVLFGILRFTRNIFESEAAGESLPLNDCGFDDDAGTLFERKKFGSEP